MAFYSKNGVAVSFECGDLIEELEADILEFGPALMVDVVTIVHESGVKLYKDYNFIENDPETEFVLKPGEKLERISAAKLLELYQQQDDPV